MGRDWAHLVLRPLFSQMIDDDCGEIGGMRIGRGNRTTRRKPAPMPLYPPQITHDLTWARTRRLTAWAMARPLPLMPKVFFPSLPGSPSIPFFHGVVIEKLVWVNGFCPFLPGGMTSSFDIISCFLSHCSRVTYYDCQDFSGGPNLYGLIMVSGISFVQLPVSGRLSCL
jgi:hypothetical protein